ncbi:unnamed protein product [Chondrus crispus]|uniref:JmjC domain-containing protein n=1 Tax=Chondrus crispus TaxID=2769 RepID=R7QQI4_CHOCR|nr:unnamed protein product [Chondrus crispus]CDF40389.1 unnamed protein product [Chondrus crispus]|eukprot:XP_005710683.1 unnamed protein product [Chondrus crispus]
MLRPPAEAAGRRLYMAQHPLFDYVPALEDDVRQPEYIRVAGKSRADLTNVWMGTAGSGSNLHFDSADNLLVQIVGEKRVVLVAPHFSKCLYPREERPNVSPVRVDAPDLHAFPLFRNVHAQVLHLRPGDALYIPPAHWHWVQSITASISVNFWF